MVAVFTESLYSAFWPRMLILRRLKEGFVYSEGRCCFSTHPGFPAPLSVACSASFALEMMETLQKGMGGPGWLSKDAVLMAAVSWLSPVPGGGLELMASQQCPLGQVSSLQLGQQLLHLIRSGFLETSPWKHEFITPLHMDICLNSFPMVCCWFKSVIPHCGI